MFFTLRILFETIIKRLGIVSLTICLFVHLAVSYAGMRLLGETDITQDFVTFLYWYFTTTTTVGYGDLSPKSDAGRMLTILWVMIGGIAIITGFIGSATSYLVELWRNRVKGNMNYESMTGHTLVIGWYGEQSERLIELLLAECKVDEKIILCDSTLEENPFHGKIGYVRGESLTSNSVLSRAGVKGAKRILITGRNDDHTLAIALAVNCQDPSGHLVAHFSSSQTASIAKRYVQNIEIASSMTMEMLVRSARDPGASEIIYDLLSIDNGVTLFSHKVVAGSENSYSDISRKLRETHQSTLIGHRKSGVSGIEISPADRPVNAGDEIYYISPARLPEEAFQ